MWFSVKEIADAVNGKILYGNENTEISKVGTDSRENLDNKLFIPLKGENFDGHKFIETALQNGAKGFLTDREIKCYDNAFCVLVKDTKLALGDLAKFAISKLDATVIGITGSVGKTTTRQFIASVTAMLGKTLVTQKNFNNDVGLPLSILEASGDEKYVVLEMGMSSLGEISYLTKIANPHIAVITSIGMSHIEKLKTQENILKAKLEILDGIRENGVLFLNGDDEILSKINVDLNINVKYFGIKNCDYPITITKSDMLTRFICNNEEYAINVIGKHNVLDSSAAIAIGKYLGATHEQIADGLLNFNNVKWRQEIHNVGKIQFIVDCYNASYDSMKAALDVLKEKKINRTVAILGGIGELGEYTEEILTKVGKKVAESNIDILIAADENSKFIANGAMKNGMKEKNIFYFPTKEALLPNLNAILKDGDTVLVKASRRYEFEKIFEYFKR